MKERYEQAELEVILFEADDIIVTSNGGGSGSEGHEGELDP